MPPKEPTRQQLSSRLQYSSTTPRFLQQLQRRIAGEQDSEDEFEPDDGSGRPPIPRRPAIPQRPDDDPGSADEDDGDEKPQVVVLREGKHLTEREAENIRRQERGLPPLPDPTTAESESSAASQAPDKAPPKAKPPPPSLSFSSAKNGFKTGAAKRKAVAIAGSSNEGTDASRPPKKKNKKETKTLLSFGDDT